MLLPAETVLPVAGKELAAAGVVLLVTGSVISRGECSIDTASFAETKETVQFSQFFNK